MTILLVGGGTGGHITPLLAVARRLKTLHPEVHIVHVSEKKGKFNILARDASIDESHTVYAGKFRRYFGETWLQRIVDVRTNLLNIRDAWFTLVGCVQSITLLRKLKPDVVFIKGGFVGVPIGLAAALLEIPFVTHDSDVIPGLANRLIGRWAALHAVGMPKEFYTYPSYKTEYVGIPLGARYKPVDAALQRSYAKKIGAGEKSRIITVIGGSLGAVRLNQAVATIVPKLLAAYPDLSVIHQVGKGNAGLYESLDSSQRHRVVEREFLTDAYIYTGAADVVVTRAGATSLAELSVQHKACIIVPNPLLTGGHQLKNAEELRHKGAVWVVDEAQIEENQEVLLHSIRKLLDNTRKRQELARNFGHFGRIDAAEKLANLIYRVGSKKK